MQKLVLMISLVVALFYVSSCSLSEDTVAKVGNKTITADIYKQHLARRFSQKESYTTVDSAAKYAVLDHIILNELKAQAAKDMDLDQDPEFQAELKNQKSRVMGSRYFEKTIVDKLFPEEAIRAEFEKQKQQMKASHVLISYKGAKGSKVKRTKEQALSLAREVASKANNGVDFATLAEKYSDDPSAKRNKGDLGYFTWGRMVPQFQEAAFSMEINEISDPVETDYGFHIIKLVDRRDNPDFDESKYASEKMNIKRNLYFTKKDSGIAMWKRHTDALRDSYDFELNEENIKTLVDSSAKLPQNADASAYSDAIKELVLAKWSGGELTVNDLFLMYGKRFSGLKGRMKNVDNLQKEVKNASLADLIIAECEKNGIAEEPEVEAQLGEMINSRLASKAEAEQVRKKATVTEEEMKKYYDEHSDEFVKPAEIDLWEIYVTDEALAKRLARKVKAGANFEKLAAKYSEDRIYKKSKGHVGFRQEKRRGVVSQEAFKLGPNKVGGPIKYRKGWTIIKTGKMNEEALKSFASVKSTIMSKLRNNKMKDLRKAWEEELRNKYSVKINNALVESI